MEVQRQQDTPVSFIMRTRKGYSPQQREAREQADRVLREQACALLADPDAVAAMVTQLVTVSRSPKVLRYSLRNQALLVSQAEQRGMTLTDVDSYRGWCNRGRCVREGERGLRIVAPKGTETNEDTDPDEVISTKDENQSGEELRVRFRMESRFDISQTDGIDDAEIVGQAAEVSNPAAVLRDALTEQLQRRGYTIIVAETATGGAEIDQYNRIVRLPAAAELPELARTVAQLLTGTKPAQLAAC
jgi:N-terminal domain of anti-restriction factor ArdC